MQRQLPEGQEGMTALREAQAGMVSVAVGPLREAPVLLAAMAFNTDYTEQGTDYTESSQASKSTNQRLGKKR